MGNFLVIGPGARSPTAQSGQNHIPLHTDQAAGNFDFRNYQIRPGTLIVPFNAHFLFLTYTPADGLSEGRRTVNFLGAELAKSTGYFFFVIFLNLNSTTFLR